MADKLRYDPLPGWLRVGDWQDRLQHSGQFNLGGDLPPADSLMLAKPDSGGLILVSAYAAPPILETRRMAKQLVEGLAKAGNLVAPVETVDDCSSFSFTSPDGIMSGTLDVRRLSGDDNFLAVSVGMWDAQDHERDNASFRRLLAGLRAG